MDKTLTREFIRWLLEQGISLQREDTSWVTLDDVDGLMDAFIGEWFDPNAIRARIRARKE